MTPWHLITDWAEKSNATIAAETGRTAKQVQQYRRRRKLPIGPRSPGSGLYSRNRPPRNTMTMRVKVKRLEAVWACLWPDDPTNAQHRDEVAAINQRICCAQLP